MSVQSGFEDQASGEREPLSNPVVLGVEAYLSHDFARAEQEQLWRKVWQQAERVEDIPNVGDYVTYEIMDDCVVIVRTGLDEIRAFHNVCQHRGRRLVDIPKGMRNVRGNARRFVCGYHGWSWGMDGENLGIPEKEDWKGCLNAENTRLAPVKVDTWGGWLWVNLDPNCEPLADYLKPIAEILDPFQMQNMRYRWRRYTKFDCNWKVAMEAFSEAYHVPATHPQMMPFGRYIGWSKRHGIHSQIGYDAPKDLKGAESKMRLGAGDPRKSTAEMQRYAWDFTDGIVTTKTLVDAAERLVDELEEGTPADQVLNHWIQSAMADDAARGVIWPSVDAEHRSKAGNAWQVFPNFQIGHSLTNALCYRAIPCDDDPNRCLFEASVLELYPEGGAPETEWLLTEPGDPDWKEALPQDFSNMAAVQKGMKSLGFKGPRPNPKQERAIASLHRSVAEFMGTRPPQPLK